MVRMIATPVIGNTDLPGWAASLEMTDDCPADAMGQCLAEAMQNIQDRGRALGNRKITYIIQFEEID